MKCIWSFQNQIKSQRKENRGGKSNEFKNPLIVVSDIEKSATFYKTVLGLYIIMDFAAKTKCIDIPIKFVNGCLSNL